VIGLMLVGAGKKLNTERGKRGNKRKKECLAVNPGANPTY